MNPVTQRPRRQSGVCSPPAVSSPQPLVSQSLSDANWTPLNSPDTRFRVRVWLNLCKCEFKTSFQWSFFYLFDSWFYCKLVGFGLIKMWQQICLIGMQWDGLKLFTLIDVKIWNGDFCWANVSCQMSGALKSWRSKCNLHFKLFAP